MKIVVLGYTGMLGKYVSNYFKSKKFNVLDISRETIDASNIKENELRAKIINLGISENDVIINCIGLIKQRNDISNLQFLLVNSIFPLILANVCENESIKLIHPTTDCVYDGLDGYYDKNFNHNATDIYGKSKSLGEPHNATVIRTSIIGDEINNSRSLIEWVKSNKDGNIDGYLNHKWNGVTCLEFAKISETIINKNLFWNGIEHIVSPTVVNKNELLNMINYVYELNIKINPIETEIKCDRSVKSTYRDIVVPELYVQIKEMKEFYKILNTKY